MDQRAVQGALEVQPAADRHSHSQEPPEDYPKVAVEVPEGSVTFYRLDSWHRGGPHALQSEEDRLVMGLQLMGEHGVVPCQNPLAVYPEDAGRWWMGHGQLITTVSE